LTTPTSATGSGVDPAVLASTLKSAASSSTAGSSALGKDAFMSLLVSSMRYQDPSNPTDSQAYMAQLAQFAQVEKLEAIAASQAELTQWQRTVAGQGMLGRLVTGTGDAGSALTGTVTGVTLSSSGPRLTLSDGGTLDLDSVTAVQTAGSAPAAPPASPTS
jgi:flagellar basal-body rod modification protein FlgD